MTVEWGRRGFSLDYLADGSFSEAVAAGSFVQDIAWLFLPGWVE